MRMAAAKALGAMGPKTAGTVGKLLRKLDAAGTRLMTYAAAKTLEESARVDRKTREDPRWRKMLWRPYRDEATRVYDAEHHVQDTAHGRSFKGLDEIRDWLVAVSSTEWFRSRYGNLVRGFNLRGGPSRTWANGERDLAGVCHLTLPALRDAK